MRKYTPLYTSSQLIYWPYYQTATCALFLLIILCVASGLLSIWLAAIANFPENTIVVFFACLVAVVSLLGIFSINKLRYTRIRIASTCIEITNHYTQQNICILWENVLGIEYQIQHYYGLEWYIVLYTDSVFLHEHNGCEKSIRLPLRNVDQSKIKALILEHVCISLHK